MIGTREGQVISGQWKQPALLVARPVRERCVPHSGYTPGAMCSPSPETSLGHQALEEKAWELAGEASTLLRETEKRPMVTWI